MGVLKKMCGTTSLEEKGPGDEELEPGYEMASDEKPKQTCRLRPSGSCERREAKVDATQRDVEDQHCSRDRHEPGP